MDILLITVEEVAKDDMMAIEPLKLIFTCPTQKCIFENAEFSILENRGVIVDKSGKKTLDAKVALTNPCPLCGEKHVYHVSEVACPFELPKNKGDPRGKF